MLRPRKSLSTKSILGTTPAKGAAAQRHVMVIPDSLPATPMAGRRSTPFVWTITLCKVLGNADSLPLAITVKSAALLFHIALVNTGWVAPVLEVRLKKLVVSKLPPVKLGK